MLEVDPRWPDTVFNTTCLVGPEGVLAKYRKVNPWIPWEVHASPHDIDGYPDDPLPVTDTEIGKLAVATCYDWLFPEVLRELALKGAEVLVRISAYMDPWGATAPMDWWTVVNRCRALENTAFVVAANQGASLAHYPPFSWPGGSMVVDYDGRVLAEAPPGPGERIVVGPIHVGALREERRRRVGHSMLAHLRTELFPRQRAAVYPGARSAAERDVETQQRLIDETKRGLGL
jgi:predicted amidohydrolase